MSICFVCFCCCSRLRHRYPHHHHHHHRHGHDHQHHYYCNRNYNKIFKSDWLSTALISALIGQFNRTVRIMPK